MRSQFLIGDGQVSLGNQVIKPNARKVRQIKEGVICGFAGATADAMTLLERLEMKLQEHPETLRACVEMAKGWRMDKYLRRLEAIMIVCDANVSLTLTGNGDVIEPVDGVIGIGSGGLFATAAARALLDVPGMDAEAIGRKAMTIAADSERLASLPSGDRLASREAPRLQECMPNPDLCACFCCSLLLRARSAQCACSPTTTSSRCRSTSLRPRRMPSRRQRAQRPTQRRRRRMPRARRQSENSVGPTSAARTIGLPSSGVTGRETPTREATRRSVHCSESRDEVAIHKIGSRPDSDFSQCTVAGDLAGDSHR